MTFSGGEGILSAPVSASPTGDAETGPGEGGLLGLAAPVSASPFGDAETGPGGCQ